jgi:hypothetical protein
MADARKIGMLHFTVIEYEPTYQLQQMIDSFVVLHSFQPQANIWTAQVPPVPSNCVGQCSADYLESLSHQTRDRTQYISGYISLITIC